MGAFKSSLITVLSENEMVHILETFPSSTLDLSARRLGMHASPVLVTRWVINSITSTLAVFTEVAKIR